MLELAKFIRPLSQTFTDHQGLQPFLDLDHRRDLERGVFIIRFLEILVSEHAEGVQTALAAQGVHAALAEASTAGGTAEASAAGLAAWKATGHRPRLAAGNAALHAAHHIRIRATGRSSASRPFTACTAHAAHASPHPLHHVLHVAGLAARKSGGAGRLAALILGHAEIVDNQDVIRLRTGPSAAQERGHGQQPSFHASEPPSEMRSKLSPETACHCPAPMAN